MKNYILINKENYKSKYGEISSSIVEEKKSKFISYIFNISDDKQALEYIDIVKKENKDARHVVYIYSYLNNNVLDIKFSDDGEPKGTGTKAIYELLTKEGITNILIVIVRYFGGILLGAGLLSRTYLNSARESILLCDKKEIFKFVEKEYTFKYHMLDKVKNIINKNFKDDIIILDINYTDIISINLKIKSDKVVEFEELIKEFKL